MHPGGRRLRNLPPRSPSRAAHANSPSNQPRGHLDAARVHLTGLPNIDLSVKAEAGVLAVRPGDGLVPGDERDGVVVGTQQGG